MVVVAFVRGSIAIRATLAAVLAGLAAGGAAGASTASRLVSMRQNNGQVWETVTVERNGAAEVGIFIGEVTGTHYLAFRLPERQLAKLRSLVAGTQTLPRDDYPGSFSSLPFVSDTEYVIETSDRSFTAAAGHAPARLSGLITYLSRLIEEHAQAASSSRRTSPRLAT